MDTFTILAYLVALGIILIRATLMLKRAIDVVIDAEAQGYTFTWPLHFLFDGVFWSRTLQLASDITMSSLGMLFCRVAIAGTASAPIGAMLGLGTSFLITGSGAYFQSRRKQRA